MRVSCKAVIVRDQSVLLIECQDPEGEDYFILPGGGMEAGESVHEALRRECREEIGAEIIPGPLLCLRDYIPRKGVEPDKHEQQLELMFACSLKEGQKPANGASPDAAQTGICWIELEDLPLIRLYPESLVERLPFLLDGAGAVYFH